MFSLKRTARFFLCTEEAIEYVKGLNGHYEIAMSVKNYAEVDKVFDRVVKMGAKPVLFPETEEWGQRTCYIADPEGNLIEIGSFNEE